MGCCSNSVSSRELLKLCLSCTVNHTEGPCEQVNLCTSNCLQYNYSAEGQGLFSFLSVLRNCMISFQPVLSLLEKNVSLLVENREDGRDAYKFQADFAFGLMKSGQLVQELTPKTWTNLVSKLFVCKYRRNIRQGPSWPWKAIRLWKISIAK